MALVSCDRPASVRPGDQRDTPLLSFARTGGIAGFQDKLVVGYSGEYYVAQSTQELIGTLSTERRTQLGSWRDSIAPFTLKLEDNPGGPDNMVRQLVWQGRGKINADEQKQLEMLDWVSNLFVELSAPSR
jgi:hypothetical protein